MASIANPKPGLTSRPWDDPRKREQHRRVDPMVRRRIIGWIVLALIVLLFAAMFVLSMLRLLPSGDGERIFWPMP